jgi:hypothetical protein
LVSQDLRLIVNRYVFNDSILFFLPFFSEVAVPDEVAVADDFTDDEGEGPMPIRAPTLPSDGVWIALPDRSMSEPSG